MAAAPHVNWAARRIPSSRRPLLPGPTVSVVARAMDAGSFGLDTTAQNTARDRRHGHPRLADVLGQGVLMACCRSRAVTVEENAGPHTRVLMSLASTGHCAFTLPSLERSGAPPTTGTTHRSRKGRLAF